jgi:hypothetical protein
MCCAAPGAALGGTRPACCRDATVRGARGSAGGGSCEAAVPSPATRSWCAASTRAGAWPPYAQPWWWVRLRCHAGVVQGVWAWSSGGSSPAWGALPRRGVPRRGRAASTAARRGRSASAAACARASRRRLAAALGATRSTRRAHAAGRAAPRRRPRAASASAACWCAGVPRAARSSRPRSASWGLAPERLAWCREACPGMVVPAGATVPRCTSPAAPATRSPCPKTSRNASPCRGRQSLLVRQAGRSAPPRAPKAT